MPDPPPPPPDRVLCGRYRLVRLLAQGRTTEVWEGHDQVLTRPVAVKLLHPDLAGDADFVARFRGEAVAAARLVHPGIVATYDTGADDGVAFIVMELVRGPTLRQALTDSGAMPLGLAVPIAAQVADALDHAHRAGLVHRDVKPANIVVVEQPGAAAAVGVKVADFGIARMEVDDGGPAMTSSAYLAPEQVAGGTADRRSDSYALGVVLHEMLCGEPPAAGDTTARAGRRRPAVPAALDAIVRRAVARRPEDRYQSLADFRDALLSLDLAGDKARDLAGDPADDEPTGEMDAVAGEGRAETPPGGTSPLVRPAASRRGPLAGVAALSILVLVVVGLLLAGGGSGGGGGRGGGTGPGNVPGGVGPAVAIESARSFDPMGDGEENEARVALVIDGNPSTVWATEKYDARPFGGLKNGVGLVIGLARPTEVVGVDVASPTRGWTAEVYVADSARATLAEWGRPVATSSGAISGDTSFEFDGRRAGAVLVWITDTGADRRVEVSEVSVRQ
ncbi:MAG: protein kinase domain-containing protein [Acidimicrobiales bacterium]